MRNYRRAKADGHKVCNRCNGEFPATLEHFIKDATRPSGLSYECRPCHRERKRGRENRTDRWANQTPEQREKAKARQLRYGRTDKGRAVFLRKAYERVDACDLSTSEVLDLITKPCVHCGTTDSPRGLDRIDNALPHIKGNVAPSCAPCNFARGDRFTFEEMRVIGKVIRQIMQDRLSCLTQNVAHL